ncbi:alpha-amylase family glycosyl hydrolase [Verrucomicrobiales bacterium]|nr:alpha-amylase family glycosyl hydrolase [Verrucomicrobiales bacterium]
MPVAQSAGNWNWGYDGVNLFAPANAYGRPEDLIALIDAAHSRGLAVILDVVYNHFGPEGNYLFAFGDYLSPTHTTPWGDAPHFDGFNAAPLRAFILENVRYWIEDFGFDGLRVDANHFIKDTSGRHIVSEIGEYVRVLETKLGRTLHLIGETNVYDPKLISSIEDGGSSFTGLWCDEFLHAHYAQLQPGEQAIKEVAITVDGEILLSRNCSALDEGAVIQAQAYAVLAGTGRAMIR